RLPDDAAPAVLGIVHPALGWGVAGIDADRDHERPGERLEMTKRGHGRRGEPAIEADHQLPRAVAIGPLDLLELLLGEREGLFDEHVLARFERLTDEPGVASVPREHEDQIDVRILEDLGGARRAR